MLISNVAVFNVITLCKQVLFPRQQAFLSGVYFCAKDAKSSSYQKHAESFPHDAVEEVKGRVSNHHKEVGQEEELSAAVVQQSVVLTAEQRLIRILQGQEQ